MPDFILLMHNDAARQTRPEEWDRYIGSLRAGGHFEGGSAMGGGVTIKGDERCDKITAHLGGYIVITAKDLNEAAALTNENPARLAGATVEVRELPRT